MVAKLRIDFRGRLARALSATRGALTAVLLGCVAVAALVRPTAAEQERAEPTFYFYSPDWRPSDLNVFTEAFERVLASEGIEVRLQAFARFDDFTERLRNAPPSFVMAPSWISTDPDVGFTTELIAQPVRAGRTVYRKALMTTDAVEVVQDLTHGSIAATVHTFGADGERTVLKAFNLDPTTTTVVPVPKDADALLALSFGQVDGALVTSAQFEAQSAANPNVTRELRVLAFTPDIDLPGVYATELSARSDRRAVADALDRLSGYQTGRSILEMFGYDEFELTRASLRERREDDRLRRHAPAAYGR